MELELSLRSVIVGLLIGPLLVLAGCDKRSDQPEQASAANAAQPSPDEVVSGAPTAPLPGSRLDRSHKGAALPTLGFQDAHGARLTLARFTGKPMLVNLWATWCAPCVREMPTLNALAAREQGKLQVITIAQEKPGPAAAFLAQHKLAALPGYVDPELGFSIAYQASLPMTLLFDAKGHEVWRRIGGTDWTSPEAKALIAEAR